MIRHARNIQPADSGSPWTPNDGMALGRSLSHIEGMLSRADKATRTASLVDAIRALRTAHKPLKLALGAVLVHLTGGET